MNMHELLEAALRRRRPWQVCTMIPNTEGTMFWTTHIWSQGTKRSIPKPEAWRAALPLPRQQDRCKKVSEWSSLYLPVVLFSHDPNNAEGCIGILRPLFNCLDREWAWVGLAVRVEMRDTCWQTEGLAWLRATVGIETPTWIEGSIRRWGSGARQGIARLAWCFAWHEFCFYPPAW